jgi:DNA-binding NarL/FixJ family response regulator
MRLFSRASAEITLLPAKRFGIVASTKAGMSNRLSKPKKTGSKTKVLLVEDHPVFRDGLTELLNAEPDLVVCGDAANAEDGFKLISSQRPDLVLVDIGLPGKSGLELIKEVRAAKMPVKLLAVSMFDEAIYAQRVLRAGGDGYVMKQEDPETIVLAIRDVLAGHIYVSEEVFLEQQQGKSLLPKASTSLEHLSDSDLTVLELLGSGKGAKEIAKSIDQPVRKVEKQIAGIQKKLNLDNPNALILFAADWVKDAST